MTEQRFSLKGGRDFDLHCVLWLPEGKPKAVIQVIHGMTEHIGRYENFADELVKEGVYQNIDTLNNYIKTIIQTVPSAARWMMKLSITLLITLVMFWQTIRML